jgi:hypothetical protein
VVDTLQHQVLRKFGRNLMQTLKVVGAPRYQVSQKVVARYSQLGRDAKNMGRNLSKDLTLVKVSSLRRRTRNLIRYRLHTSVYCRHTTVYVSGRHRILRK